MTCNGVSEGENAEGGAMGRGASYDARVIAVGSY